MAPKALIFDVDGTLAETEEAHRQAFNETFAELGLNDTWPDETLGWVWDRETYARLLKTTGGKERIAAYMRDDLAMAPESHVDRIAEIHQKKTARFVDILAGGGLKPRDGIVELVAKAREKGHRLAIATTTSRPNVEAVCRSLFERAAEDVFDRIAAGDEVPAKKPAPDVYLLALERLAMPAGSCVALEDSLNGLRSAKAAGLVCLVSPSAYTASEDLSSADRLLPDFDPDQVLAAVDELLGATG